MGVKVSTVDELPIAGSGLTHGAIAPGGALLSTSFPFTHFVAPPDLDQADQLARWSQSVTVEFDVALVSSARIINGSVIESPFAVCFEHDDPSSLWTSHIGPTSQVGGGIADPQYPMVRRTTDDPRLGTEHMSHMIDNQLARLGPIVASWSGSATAEPGEYHCLWDSAQTAYDATRPGLSASSGGYGARHIDCRPHVLRDRIAAIPVRVFAYAELDDGAGQLVVQTAQHSMVRVPLTASGWHASGRGYLEVGVTPDQPTVLQAFVGHTGVPESDTSVRAFVVAYDGATEGLA